jgi:hypothetical protein
MDNLYLRSCLWLPRGPDWTNELVHHEKPTANADYLSQSAVIRLYLSKLFSLIHREVIAEKAAACLFHDVLE